MLVFVSGHFPVLGMQMLYFADPELAQRSAVPAPIALTPPIPARTRVDKPELITDDEFTSPLERGFIEELGRP
jgi:hypothetical protein